jgi:aryl-alcohol dehydrogenase-like predicted oxidoreductase
VRVRYRRLGRTELEVSVIGVGTWQYGGEWAKDFTPHEVGAILGRAGDLGVNLIDTAECYGDHLSESLIGSVIHAQRDDWVVATKFGHRYHGRNGRTQEWAPSEVVAQLERSLRALRTDYIDLYQFHSGDDAALDRDDLWEMLWAQVDAGKVRHLGVSLGSNADLRQTRRASEVGASVIQVAYSRLDTEPEAEVLPWCQQHGLGVLSREALGGGLLTGTYRPGDTFDDPADTRSTRPADSTQRRLEEVVRVAEVELPRGVPMPAWALGWCLANPAVTAVLPGCKSVEQLEANVAAANVKVARAA